METSKAYTPCGTFSILAISPDSRLMGVGVASGSTHVGDRVPHAKPGIGVIATQAYTNITYGTRGLELLAMGLPPQEALDSLSKEDPKKDLRQVAIMDFQKRKAVFTGANTPEYRAEIVMEDCIVIGNLLSKTEVVSSMVKQFESSSGNIALRIANALRAGVKSGGDRRGEKSAALMIVSMEKTEVEIRVDIHENPVEKLHRKLKLQL